MNRSKIIGTGMAVPKYCMTNRELETFVDTSDEWIRTRTGIEQRYISRHGETCVSIAAEASKMALKNAKLSPDELGMIIFATLTPNRVMPASACEMGAAIGAGKAAGFDLTAACSGFVFALAVADQFIRTGLQKNILCVGAEQLSPYINWKDRGTCVLFGDGAGAAVLTATTESDPHKILSTHMYSDGQHGDLLCIPASGSQLTPHHENFRKEDAFITMMGKELYKYAVTGMIRAGNEAMEFNKVTPEDIDLLIPHQANIRIIEAVGKRLRIPAEKTMVNVNKYGNTSAGTIPIALHEAVVEGRAKPGDLVLLDSFGGGLTYGSCLLRL